MKGGIAWIDLEGKLLPMDWTAKTVGFFVVILVVGALSAGAGTGSDVPPTLRLGKDLVFIEVPGGCFDMGQSEGDPDERPVHRVRLSRFWMGRTEVTNAAFRRFRPDHHSGSYRGRSLDGDRRPAVNLSWSDAMAFAAWVTDRSGGRYQVSLPTEAQWEWVCRKGGAGLRMPSPCAGANVYDGDAEAVFDFPWPRFSCRDGWPVTAPVGRRRPDALGLYDLIGNVWEWCADRYRPDGYRHHGRRNPRVAGPGMSRVVRGGGWSDEPKHVGCGQRDGYWEDYRGPFVGFRLAVTD